jgi:phosphoribosylanthranilate isomerase
MIGRVRVKICGITRRRDAEMAVALGADALGFIFWPRSPRATTPATVREIGAVLPPFVARVGVFVNTAADEIGVIVRDARLSVVQLHGDEGLAPYLALGTPLVRSVSLETDALLEGALALPGAVTPIVDAADPARRGGTGQRADWARATVLARARPVILAGGLSPETVVEAVDAVRPWAVDVSSGVEEAPGLKSESKLEAFFAALSRIRASAPDAGQSR